MSRSFSPSESEKSLQQLEKTSQSFGGKSELSNAFIFSIGFSSILRKVLDSVFTQAAGHAAPGTKLCIQTKATINSINPFIEMPPHHRQQI